MQKLSIPHLTLGSTSFLVPENFVNGFRFAAERCQDVSLLLLCVGEGGKHLIKRDEAREIAAIAQGEGVSVNIHLPADHSFDSKEEARLALQDVEQVMERIAPLNPHSFVQHVYFPRLRNVLLGANPEGLHITAEQHAFIRQTLRDIAALLPGPEYLAVENLETFPPDLWDQWVDDSPYSRCMDVGHFWKDGWDPVPELESWLPRVRIIHFHGLASGHGNPVPEGVAARTLPMTALRARLQGLFGMLPKDHTSLRFMPDDCIDAVLHRLWDAKYEGVLNLEVFHVDDLTSSHQVIMRSWERYQARQDVGRQV